MAVSKCAPRDPGLCTQVSGSEVLSGYPALGEGLDPTPSRRVLSRSVPIWVPKAAFDPALRQPNILIDEHLATWPSPTLCRAAIRHNPELRQRATRLTSQSNVVPS